MLTMVTREKMKPYSIKDRLVDQVTLLLTLWVDFAQFTVYESIQLIQELPVHLTGDDGGQLGQPC